ncbi:MAG TPA: YIP1 family protein [Steroidobacteraceae bacterium]|nr:YIP1 family protein [Steroidobacteraceae bacterium]
MNNLALSVALATAPSSAFEELRERPRFWFPLLLVVLSTAGLIFWYYSIVDIEWLKATMISSDPKFQQMSEEQRAAAMSMFDRTSLLWSSVVSMFVIIPAVFVLQALYLLVAAKVTKLPQGFKHWFALACWTSLPALLTTVVSAILLLLRENSQVSASVLAPLSLNELLFHVPPGGPGYTLFESLGIPAFLGWALMIIGVRTWSQRSWGFSSIVVLLPWVVIYVLWAFFAFR